LAGLLGHGAPGGFGLEFFFLHEEKLGRARCNPGATENHFFKHEKWIKMGRFNEEDGDLNP